MAKPLKSILEQYVAEGFKTSPEFNAAHKKIVAAGFVKSQKHSSPGMNFYNHTFSGHSIGISDTTHGTPEIEGTIKTDTSVKYVNVDHKDLDSHLSKVDSRKSVDEEMTDDEIDAHNDSFNDKVGDAHDKYIAKKFGKNANVNWGAIHDEDGDHGEFTSKVYHPKKGKIYVTTHYNTKTHEVHKHTEE